MLWSTQNKKMKQRLRLSCMHWTQIKSQSELEINTQSRELRLYPRIPGLTAFCTWPTVPSSRTSAWWINPLLTNGPDQQKIQYCPSFTVTWTTWSESLTRPTWHGPRQTLLKLRHYICPSNSTWKVDFFHEIYKCWSNLTTLGAVTVFHQHQSDLSRD